MKVLQVDKFFYAKGGAEQNMFRLAGLLKKKGHEVAFFSMQHDKNLPSEWSRFFVRNVDYNKKHDVKNKVRIFCSLLYSREAERKITELIDYFKPDIAHIRNFNHQLTPSILVALRKKGVPFVIILNDYKLVCPSYLMLNHGRLCELCKGQKFYHSFRTKCHKDSYLKSCVVMLESYLNHKVLQSYKPTKCYICPSRFIMNKAREMGLRGNFVHIPYFLDSFGPRGKMVKKDKNGIVYWGRLSEEKGIMALVRAVEGEPLNLTIIGEGPLRCEIEDYVKEQDLKNVKLAGRLEGDKLAEEIRRNMFSVFPSLCNEAFGAVVLESYALGMPVVGARVGAYSENIREKVTGLLFEPGNHLDLREKIKWLLARPEEITSMGNNAKDILQEEYGSQLHYERLMAVYDNAISMRK